MRYSDQQSQNRPSSNTFLTRVCATLTLFVLVIALNSAAGAASLDDYVEEALTNNLALRQKTFSYQQSRSALAEARGAFLPSVDISSRYTRSGGGRTIEFPVGDLMNPVYGSLNQLLGEQRFPTNLENEYIQFLRDEEQETKLTVTQALFHPELYYSQRSKGNFSRATEAERDAFARELVADVKTAYHNFVKASKIVELLDETRALLVENVRVSEALYNNQKVTRDIVYRAQAELSSLEQQQAEANLGYSNARAYFNFLLNRPLDQSIDMAEQTTVLSPISDIPTLQSQAIGNRDIIRQLDYTERGTGNLVSLARSSYLPSVYFAFDYGVEGERYKFDSDHDFWTASLVFKWNIFRGFRDRSRTRQFKLQQKQVQLQKEQVENQIGMEARNASYAVEAAAHKVTAADARVKSERQSFRMVERKYAEGMALQVEFLNARTSLTEAEVNYINTEQDYQIALAELERVVAGYPVNIQR